MPHSARTAVLVADDSRVIRHAVRCFLDDTFEPIEAVDGEAAWEALIGRHDIGIVVTDITMPRLDGYGLICRIRAAHDERLRKLPVIVITGAQDEETRARAYACGATDFLTKPVTRDQIAERLARVLGIGENRVAEDYTKRFGIAEVELTGTPLGTPTGAPGLDEAMDCLARGEFERLALHRAELWERLRPLVEFLRRH